MTLVHSSRIPGLDTLRACAILLVIPFHASFVLKRPLLKSLFGFGWVGVDLFFVLSGFLIGGQLLQSLQKNGRLDYLDFYVRRSFRILPAYLTVLAFYAAWPGFRESKLMNPYWQFLTFSMNFFKNEKAFSHAWSLCVEEHFYLLLPIFITVCFKFSRIFKAQFLLSFLIFAGMGTRCVLWINNADFYTEVYHPTYCRLDGLIIGFTLALIKEYREQSWKQLLEKPRLLFALALVLLSLGIYFLPFTGEKGFFAWVFSFPLIAMGMGCLVVCAQAPQFWLSKMRIPELRHVPRWLIAFTLHTSK